MIKKEKEKKKAIKLRKQGLTYSEILQKVPVAKSTLSLWLRNVGLSKRQKQKLTAKKIKAAQKGGEARRRQRLKRTKEIKEKANKEVDNLIKDSFWTMGVSLYWAEGAKSGKNTISQGIEFVNSDPKMIKIFIKWLEKYLKIKEDRMVYRLYIHENGNVRKGLKFWANVVNCNEDKIKVYLKKHNPKTNRKYSKENYYGLLALRIKKSTDLNRKIQGWIEGICEKSEVV